MAGDRGMVLEEEGILFVRSLGGGQMLCFMGAGILIYVVAEVAVVFLGASLLADYPVKISSSFFGIILFHFKEIY